MSQTTSFPPFLKARLRQICWHYFWIVFCSFFAIYDKRAGSWFCWADAAMAIFWVAIEALAVQNYRAKNGSFKSAVWCQIVLYSYNKWESHGQKEEAQAEKKGLPASPPAGGGQASVREGERGGDQGQPEPSDDHAAAVFDVRVGEADSAELHRPPDDDLGASGRDNQHDETPVSASSSRGDGNDK